MAQCKRICRTKAYYLERQPERWIPPVQSTVYPRLYANVGHYKPTHRTYQLVQSEMPGSQMQGFVTDHGKSLKLPIWGRAGVLHTCGRFGETWCFHLLASWTLACSLECGSYFIQSVGSQDEGVKCLPQNAAKLSTDNAVEKKKKVRSWRMWRRTVHSKQHGVTNQSSSAYWYNNEHYWYIHERTARLNDSVQWPGCTEHIWGIGFDYR